jgi:transposase
MAQIHSILTLRSRKWSYRRIGRELGIHRETVKRYVALAAEGGSSQRLVDTDPAAGPAEADSQNRPNPPTGSDDLSPSDSPGGSEDTSPSPVSTGPTEHPSILQNRPNPPAGSDDLNPSSAPAGSSGPVSKCEPFREQILQAIERGLSRQRIWQDLQLEHGFDGSYDSVKRFVRRLAVATDLPFRRMECAPGEEAQIDFGTGAPIIGADGKRRRTHVLRVVLSHSRKAYSESVFRQTVEDFVRALENAFHHFGGAPKTLVPDNLKAAVIKADWFDPVLNPKIEAFCRHYDTVLLPTKPRTPRHKGKVEAGVKYVQANALKGRRFATLLDQNQFLLDWEQSVADTRIHGTTRKQVGKLFQEVERAALLPLPVDRFPFFHEAKRSVHRDGHVAVDKAYYSVPPEYLTREVWVRWDCRMVRIFDSRMHQIAVHPTHLPGKFSTLPQHIAKEKISGVERGTAYLMNKASLIGSHATRWAESMLQERGIQGIRVLQGLLSLASRHGDQDVEQACEIAESHGAYRLRVVRELIKRRGNKQEQFEFMDDHPIIRSLDEYEQFVQTAFQEANV